MGFDKVWYGHTPGDTEFSWGAGLVPPEKEYDPPSRRGMYRPKAPDMTVKRKPGSPRRDEPPPGFPGEIIAR